MARNKTLIERRNKKVKARYDKLINEKSEKGKSKYSYGYVLEKLEEEFDLSETTIERIIRK